jgi:HAD superfamily hydrolase (TIGR01509 family)
MNGFTLKTFPFYQAVIFDLDGVLAYTEPAIFRILKKLVSLYGIQLTPEDDRALFGLDYSDTALYLKSQYMIPETAERFVDLLLQAVLEKIEIELEPAPGGLELVETLSQRGISVGLASNSPSEYVRRVVHGLGLSTHFKTPVGREDVAKGKPFPDPYLEACRRANADPTRSLAVEDSPVGAQAALAAGMACVLIGVNSHASLDGRVSIYPTLSALQSAILAG